jgi:L-fuculose-phosphate aldolase
MTHAEIKEKMIWAGKVLVNEGQDDFTRGHISVRLPDNPSLFFMKGHSLGLDEITAENILTIDLEGNVVAGTTRRHSEVYIHSEIFKVRPDVHCILHTHPLYSIVWSGGGRPLRHQPAGGAVLQCGHLQGHHQPDPPSKEMGAGVARDLGPTAW